MVKHKDSRCSDMRVIQKYRTAKLSRLVTVVPLTRLYDYFDNKRRGPSTWTVVVRSRVPGTRRRTSGTAAGEQYPSLAASQRPARTARRDSRTCDTHHLSHRHRHRHPA
ncbi:hypothetical protein EVAR_11967_1 [Eumeta japonica]|uniref:Uncharacterized protein n=1 Tax=Eumeta variegata TaxID=151549 RepID=A0A4C1U529_EUMVA|nr:hypothetical protein EVAR_11967_1 [Eumeta japonica]